MGFFITPFFQEPTLLGEGNNVGLNNRSITTSDIPDSVARIEYQQGGGKLEQALERINSGSFIHYCQSRTCRLKGNLHWASLLRNCDPYPTQLAVMNPKPIICWARPTTNPRIFGGAISVYEISVFYSIGTNANSHCTGEPPWTIYQ